MNVKILITGGGGFIGSNLVPTLLKEGHSLTVISKSPISDFDTFQSCRVIISKFDEDKLLDECLPKTDIVIHLAYSTVPENSMKDPVFDVHSNVIPTLRLLKKMKEHKVKKIIFVSSGGVVYGDKLTQQIKETDYLKPISSYGVSKMMIEKNIELLASTHQLEYCVLRISNAYGSGQHNRKNQGVINIWLNNIQNNIKISIIGKSDIIRDYVHINDIVNAFLLVINKNVTGIYNIGTGVGTSLNDLIDEIEFVTGKKAVTEIISDRKYDVNCNILSFEKFHLATGWQPEINLKKGLKMILADE